MKANMGISGRKSLVFGRFPWNSNELDGDHSVRINHAGNTRIMSAVAVGLVLAVTIVGIGASNALAVFEPFAVQSVAATEPDDVQPHGSKNGPRIRLAALGDPNSLDAPEDRILPADRDFEFAWAAAADARADAAPLRKPPTDTRTTLTTLAPAESSDMTIGLRRTAPVYLTFLKLPEAPDPMPGLNARQSAWASFSIAMIIILLTFLALAPLRGQTARPQTEEC